MGEKNCNNQGDHFKFWSAKSLPSSLLISTAPGSTLS